MNLKEAPAKQGKTSLRLAAEMALKRLERSESELHKARAELRQALAQYVDAVNMSQERVDETVKREHEPFIYIREDTEQPFGGYEHCGQHDAGAFPVYLAPPISDYHEGWEEGFKAAKKEWVGLTDEEVIKCFDSVAFGQVEDDLIINKHVNIFTAIRYIEAKLKEKNA
jgi:hypothetical protein